MSSTLKLGMVVFLLGVSAIVGYGQHQKARISEYEHSFETYEYSDPDKLPVLISNPKIYPYFKYDGYSHESVLKQWKVVKMENDFIEVYILPEVGGKVWGAIEKSTGKEFIYRNEVMKFRNISMRGPWTSGGIEFNFGIIGHHPSTATPVDYSIRQNDDGSVSCTVGNIDLPSHTQWRVEVYLAPDKAYFETRVLWYNPTHNTQSYYNWMTGAALASDDLEFFCPGDQYIGHPGDPHAWPTDKRGKQLQNYRENNFGSSKSYHVVGEYNDFFGGYYHDSNFGFGHWSPYEEMPGQKLWLWALSRAGGIWEDLLTDDDGQYIEFQAGRLFNQFSPGKFPSPVTQVDFEPGRTDLWREIWFPVKDIGGLTDVSTKGVLHIDTKDDSIMIGVNALEASKGTLVVYDLEGNEIFTKELELAPMEVIMERLGRPDQGFVIAVPEMDLRYGTSDDRSISRSFESHPVLANSAVSNYKEAVEEMEFRNFAKSKKLLQDAINMEPGYLEALNLLADLQFRSAKYTEGLDIIKRSLAYDTYNPEANFIAGKLYEAQGNSLDALECFGWAARSLKFRSDAYVAMAEIYMAEKDLDQATKYARNALDYNRYHIGARTLLAMIARLTSNVSAAISQISAIRAIDPLNHFAKMEQYLISKHEGDKKAFIESHKSELTYQTFLELAIAYHKVGRDVDAIAVLDLAPQHPLVDLWWSYLSFNQDSTLALDYLIDQQNLSPDLVFPYRAETLEVLKWASKRSELWKIKFYLALNLWGLGRDQEALTTFEEFVEPVHFAPLYISRAHLRKQFGYDATGDLEYALQIDKKNWRSWHHLISFYKEEKRKDKMLVAAKEAFERLPDNYVIGMHYAQALLSDEKYLAAIDVLKSIHVLPFEGASQGRKLWQEAHLSASVDFMKRKNWTKAIELLEASQEWPENLGVGRPYDPDLRLSHYLLSKCHEELGEGVDAKKHLEAIEEFHSVETYRPSLNDLIAIKINKSEHQQIRFAGKWKKSSNNPLVLDYLSAFEAGDSEMMRKIEREHPNLFSNDLYDILKYAINLE